MLDSDGSYGAERGGGRIETHLGKCSLELCQYFFALAACAHRIEYITYSARPRHCLCSKKFTHRFELIIVMAKGSRQKKPGKFGTIDPNL